MNCDRFIKVIGLRQVHICDENKWQTIGSEFCTYDECERRHKCRYCFYPWPKDGLAPHACPQLNWYTVNVTGLPSMPDPIGPGKRGIALADALDMLCPGLTVFLYMQPPTSEERRITSKGWILYHPAIVGQDKLRGDLTLYSAAGLNPNETPPVFQSERITLSLCSHGRCWEFTPWLGGAQISRAECLTCRSSRSEAQSALSHSRCCALRPRRPSWCHCRLSPPTTSLNVHTGRMPMSWWWT